MLLRLLASAVLTAALMQGAAFAQDKSATSGMSGSQAKSQSAKPLPAQLEQKLKNQGFTDVQVVPGSYIISAKDKDGDPVTAIIGPNSMTVFTLNTSGTGSTTGSGGSGESGSSKQ